MDMLGEFGHPDQVEVESSTNQNIELVKSLFREGVSPFNPEGRIGLHGTSIENFISMVRSNTIVQDTEKSATQGESHNDRFYITPDKASLNGSSIDEQIIAMSPNTVYQAAADYSTITAFYSYMQKQVPGVLDSDWYTHFVLSPKVPEGNMMLSATAEGRLTYQRMLERGKELGIEQQQLEQTIQDALQRRGVILAINLAQAQKYPIFIGDRVPGKEIYIQGSSLPFKGLIKGAEPMLSSTKEEIFNALL